MSLKTMTRRWACATVLTLVISHGPSVAAQDGHAGNRAPEWRAVDRALRLVWVDDRFRVALIDPELAPDPAAIASLDAFIVTETSGRVRPVIYINVRSALVERAAAGDDSAVEELAAVIHHEVRHLAGDSEADARRAEWEFLQSLTNRRPARHTLVRCDR